jgi:hypothetical protein
VWEVSIKVGQVSNRTNLYCSKSNDGNFDVSKYGFLVFFDFVVVGGPKPSRQGRYTPPPSQEEANRVYIQYRLAHYHTVMKDRNARDGKYQI